MEMKEIGPIVEAMLFIAGEPVAITDLARALEIAPFQLQEALDELRRNIKTLNDRTAKKGKWFS